jgi:hypothetical protein
VNLTASPSAAFVPEQGETGADGAFRSVMLAPLVSSETVVAVIAMASFKGSNRTLGSAALLVWPEDTNLSLSASISVGRKVLRDGESSEVEVNVSGPGGERVENATVVLLAPDLLEFAPQSGLSSANGSFRATVRASASPDDRYVEIRAQAFKRGMRGAEAIERVIVARSVTEASIWERAGGWIVLAAALLAAMALFLVLHFKYVRGPAAPAAPVVVAPPPMPSQPPAATAPPPAPAGAGPPR